LRSECAGVNVVARPGAGDAMRFLFGALALAAMVGGAAVAGEQTNWVYSRVVDKMRGSETQAAFVVASNKPDLPFPYSGGGLLALRITRPLNAGDVPPRVTLVIDGGRINCGKICSLSFKSDGGPVQELMAGSVDCGGKECLFLAVVTDNAKTPIYDKIAGAQKFTIELPIHNAPSFQYEFDVRGFSWPGETKKNPAG